MPSRIVEGQTRERLQGGGAPVRGERFEGETTLERVEVRIREGEPSEERGLKKPESKQKKTSRG